MSKELLFAVKKVCIASRAQVWSIRQPGKGRTGTYSKTGSHGLPRRELRIWLPSQPLRVAKRAKPGLTRACTCCRRSIKCTTACVRWDRSLACPRHHLQYAAYLMPEPGRAELTKPNRGSARDSLMIAARTCPAHHGRDMVASYRLAVAFLLPCARSCLAIVWEMFL